MEKNKVYSIKIDSFVEKEDVLLIRGAAVLYETCTKCNKKRNYIATAGFIYKHKIGELLPK